MSHFAWLFERPCSCRRLSRWGQIAVNFRGDLSDWKNLPLSAGSLCNGVATFAFHILLWYSAGLLAQFACRYPLLLTLLFGELGALSFYDRAQILHRDIIEVRMLWAVWWRPIQLWLLGSIMYLWLYLINLLLFYFLQPIKVHWLLYRLEILLLRWQPRALLLLCHWHSILFRCFIEIASKRVLRCPKMTGHGTEEVVCTLLHVSLFFLGLV